MVRQEETFATLAQLRLSMSRWAGMVLVALAVWFVTGLASAQASVDADLQKAESAYASLDYETANQVAKQIIQQRGIGHDQLVRVTRILVLSSAALGHDEEANQAAQKLLMYNPDYEIPSDMSPKMRQPIMLAKMYWRDRGAVPGLKVTATPSVKRPTVIRVTTRDPVHAVKSVRVGYRWGVLGNFKTVDIQAGKGIETTLPKPPKGVLRLDYYVQALDERDNIIFEEGNAGEPKTARANPPPPPKTVVMGSSKDEGGSVFSSPVFWIITGAVIVGGAAGAYFLTRKPEEVTETRPPTNAVFMPGVTCGGIGCK